MHHTPRRAWILAPAFCALVACQAAAAPGLESVGNTDGGLTWQLGTVQPGAVAREVVLFVYGPSYEQLAKILAQARTEFAGLTAPPAAGQSESVVWIRNDTTDFALEAPGSFFWEGNRQSLRCPAGGQLSRFAYYVHYNDGQPKRAGTLISKRGAVDNLRVTQPAAHAGPGQAVAVLQTLDGRLRLRIRSVMGKGPVAGVEFSLTNLSDRPLTDLRLTAYANVEAAHTHSGDYCVLDAATQGLLTVDPATKLCVLMAGLRRPARGHAGTWPSEGPLRAAAGAPFSEWEPFPGLVPEQVRRIAKAAIPHAPAVAKDPQEPETRTLTEAEAQRLLVKDWLFQADGSPTVARARREIKWARDIAQRLALSPDPPDLSGELADLTALEAKAGGIPRGAARASMVATRPDLAASRKTPIPFFKTGLTGRAEVVPGVLGEGLALSGRAHVNLGAGLAAVTTGQYTLCAWIKTTSQEADIVGNGVGRGHVLFMTYRGVLRGHHWTDKNGNVIDGKARVDDGRWRHVAQVVDDRSISLYVDGKLDHSQAFRGHKTAADSPMLIAARSTNPTRACYTGSLAGVCIFDRALKAETLAALFEEGRPHVGKVDQKAVDLYLAVRRVKRRIMFKDPTLDFDSVLFIDAPYTRGGEWAHEARHRDGMMAVPGARLLAIEGLRPGGRVRKLAPRQTLASFWRPDLSFDAKRVLFCMKPADEKSFHLYEIGIDGAGLKQITRSDYDDLDPIYLPDGKIMFSTTRCNTYIRCMPYTYAYVLARCDRDGRNIYIISRGNEPDWLPALLNDGRVAYTRWEYTDKALWRIQSLWTVNPDGTNAATFWGNQSVWPDMLIEPRPIPGSHRVMFVGAAHHDWYAGSVGILDPHQGYNFPRGLTKVTAEVPWPECGLPPLDPIEADGYHRSGDFKAYKTPYPLSEELFLVSARGGAHRTYNGSDKFRLYLMDVHGNRELIYEGAFNVLHAMPVRPRPVPPARPDRVAWPGTGPEHKPTQPGLLYSPNVYEGVSGISKGMVKHLRVIQMDSRTYSTWRRDIMPHQHQGPTVSILQSDGVKRVLGTVPVLEDGSVCLEVPAGKALHFQLLDEDYRALQTMRSFTGVMPGERRGCLGCHELHSVSPVNTQGAAVKQPARKPTPPPWGADVSMGYERMVQPLLERYCGPCHMGEGKGRAKFDATLRPGKGVFKEPYVTIVGGSVYHSERTIDPPASLAACLPSESWPRAGVPESVQTFPPMKYLSRASALVNRHAASGRHHGVRMNPRDLRMLTAWVDCMCPYRGDEDIRTLPDPDFAGIENLPIRPRVRTAPHIDRFNLPQDRVPGRDD